MKELVGYKVVSKNLTSAIVGNTQTPDPWNSQELAIQYLIDQWIEPKDKNMPIMIFNDLQAARNFVLDQEYACLHSLHIYECKYIKSKKKYGWCLGRIGCVNELRAKKKKFTHLFSKLPYRTVLADKVMLVKRVMP